MVRRFHHFARNVADMERSLVFYRDLLGLKVLVDDVLSGDVLEREVGVVGARLRLVELEAIEGNSRLELIEYEAPLGRTWSAQPWDVGVSHVALVVDDIDDVYDRLVGTGIRFTHPPQLIEGGAYAGFHIADCFDPDAQVVELLEPPGARAQHTS